MYIVVQKCEQQSLRTLTEEKLFEEDLKSMEEPHMYMYGGGDILTMDSDKTFEIFNVNQSTTNNYKFICKLIITKVRNSNCLINGWSLNIVAWNSEKLMLNYYACIYK